MFSLSLSLSLLMAPGAEGAKALIDKPADEPARGEQLEHRAIAPEVLEGLRATLLAEYETAILVEIADQDLDWAASRAVEERLGLIVREDFDRIWINGYEYPSGAPCPDLRSDQVLGSIPEDTGLWVVQMIGPPTPEWHQTMRAAGEVINVLPANTFVIRADRARAEALLRADGFHHVEPYQPAYKIQPRLARAPGEVRAIVQLDAGRDLEAAFTAIEAMAGRRFSREAKGPFRSLLVELTPEQIAVLAQRPEVVWLEPYSKPGFSDERHAMVVASQHDYDKPNSITTGLRYQAWLESQGFCAPGQTSGCISYSTRVAVFDSGLDRNQLMTVNPYGDPDSYNEVTGEGHWANPNEFNHLRHADLADREERFFCIENEDEYGNLNNLCEHAGSGTVTFRFSDQGGHGASVASLIAGDAIGGGTGTTDPSGFLKGSGVAPDANVVVAKIAGQFSPDDFERLMGRVFGIGTRFANNSWNEYADWYLLDPDDPDWPNFYHVVEYNTFSRMADQLVRDGDGGFDDSENGMTIVFSAGNYEWENHNPPYPDPNPDYLTVAPGNAKNIISVGASGGWEQVTENRGCCDQYSEIGEPSCIETDDISDVLFLSTRGTGSPIVRYKPDIVAPGTRLQAAESRERNEESSDYVCFGATSGAAPLITGAAILIDAWFGYPFDIHPSPAMIKAMLIAHAVDLGGGLEAGIDRYTGQTLPHSPSLAQGWGRLELDALFSPVVSTYRVDEDHRSGIVLERRRFRGTTTSWSKSFVRDDQNEDVIVVMVFTDAPGTPGAQYPAVNDLNLMVVDGSGIMSSRYYGNKFISGGFHSRRYPPWEVLMARDAINNVEVIRFPASEIIGGDFSIEVNALTLAGKAVPGLDGQGVPNQDFALYVVNASAVGGTSGERP